MRRAWALAAAVSAALWTAAPAEARRSAAAPRIDVTAVNEAAPAAGRRRTGAVDPLAIRAAVLLGRAGFSPGIIDGRWGDNLGKALGVFQGARDLPVTGRIDDATWARLADDRDPVLVSHTIEPAEAEGPFTKAIPAKLEAMRDLKSLGYTSPRELLAERFHMSEALLSALNPGRDFGERGAAITVAAVDRKPGDVKAARVEVDKARKLVEAVAADGTVLASYPATIGSPEKPAPSGRFEVKGIAPNPTYTYNPDYAFRGVKAKEKFDIAAGPNNPVGAVWIALTAESYGIHGTPNPETIGKAASHGCVRLTNWDVQDLSRLVRKGTPVEFKE